jgi:hypothetical protein
MSYGCVKSGYESARVSLRREGGVGTINRTSCRVVEGGLGAKIGPAVDGHRVGDLKLVVRWSSETVGAIGDGGDRGRHRGDMVLWGGWGGCDAAKIIS